MPGSPMLVVDGWCFCKGHGLEWCHSCFYDFRELNEVRIEEYVEKWEEEELLDATMAAHDWHQSHQLSAYEYGVVSGKEGDEDIMTCLNHQNERCSECLNFSQVLLKAAGIQLPEKATSTGLAQSAIAEPLIISSFNPATTGSNFPSLSEAREIHDLDLEFPNVLTYEQLPPNGEPYRDWIYLGTIVENQSLLRPVYRVRDADDVEILIAFYLDRGTTGESALTRLEVGQTISYQGPMQYMFMDGQEGFRIENDDLGDIKILPCSIAKLKAVNETLRTEGKHCRNCGKDDSNLRCIKCKSFYCSKECQLTDWKAKPNPHSKMCHIIGHLRSLNILFD